MLEQVAVPQGREEPDADQPRDRPRVHLRRGADPVPRPHRWPVADDPDRRRRRDPVAVQAPDPDRRTVGIRRLTPRELERLNGFPGDWTAGMSDGKRAFMMGNALVVGLVERIADELIKDDRACRSPSPERGRRLVAPMAGLQLPNPPPSSPAVRNVMRANRARDTGPERRLRAALREAGLGGYRLNWRKAPGRPDIAYPGRKRRDLRPRLLLAPLPALLPEPAEVEPGVLGAQVRAQPRTRRAQAGDASRRAAGWSSRHGSATIRERLDVDRRYTDDWPGRGQVGTS